MSGEVLYVGDEMEVESTVTNTKTGAPGKPDTVTVTIYSPKAQLVPPQADPTTVSAVEVPNEDLPEGSGIYELEAPYEVTEAGSWLAVVNTTAPYKATQPASQVVRSPV